MWSIAASRSSTTRTDTIGASHSTSKSSGPAGVAARPASTSSGAARGAGLHLDALVGVDASDARQERGSDVARHEQRLHRVAGAVALRLRVVGDADGLLEVGRAVDVDVAQPVEVLDHRHARLAHQPRDQPLAAARHDDVDELGHRDHRAHRRAVGAVDHLHDVGRQPGRIQSFADQRRRARALQRIASEPPRRIAALPDLIVRPAASTVTFGRAS